VIILVITKYLPEALFLAKTQQNPSGVRPDRTRWGA